jgi:hypothetical protein
MTYFSIMYKGFCLQQTDKGWYIMCAPNWGKFGPVPPPPYETSLICQVVIDSYILV